MQLSGTLKEVTKLFNDHSSVIYYYQISNNLFKVGTRTSVPSNIDTVEKLEEYYRNKKLK